MIERLHFHDTEGARQVDTEFQGCSACGGDCPCPQACERRDEALAAQKQQRKLPQWVALVCGRLA